MRRLAFFLVVAACGKKTEEPAPPSVETRPSGPRTVAQQPSQDIRGLVGSLQGEAAKRPVIDVTAEKVFDALAGAGVALQTKKQYLATTARARYCAGGKTRDGIAVAVCEYADATAAEEGKRTVEAAWGNATPNARRVIHRSTLLTITPPNANDANQVAVVDRAIGAFTRL